MTLQRQPTKGEPTHRLEIDILEYRFRGAEHFVKSKSVSNSRPRTVKKLVEVVFEEWCQHQARSAFLPTSLEDSTSTVGERKQTGNTWFVIKMVKCGKPSCRKCKNGEGHGPYRYSMRRVGGKQMWKYLGRASKSVLPTRKMEYDSQPVGKKSETFPLAAEEEEVTAKP